MSRPSVLNSPLLLGFDRLERMLDHVSKSSHEGYPPYNIEQVSENALRITLAVAGFAIEDLSILIEDNQMMIRGRKAEENTGHVYLYRGIASRQFQRAFVLAEGMEVVDARLHNGLLHIDLRRRVPEPDIRTVPIQKGSPGAASPSETETLDVQRDAS
ncbi:MAG: Hsp20 family protein [Rhodospirillales bacterium]|nr:Hsp20 family protein [Rhodospirillales bacterium]